MSEEQAAPTIKDTNTNEWADWQKHLAMLVLIVAVPLVLYFFRPVFYTFMYTVIIAFILGYLIKLLNKKLPYNLSVILVYLLFVLIVFLGVGWLIDSLAKVIVSAIEGFQTAVSALPPSVPDFSFGPFDVSKYIEPLNRIASISSGISLLSSTGITTLIGEIFSLFAGFLGDVFLIVIILLFFLLEKPRTITAIGNRIPEKSRREYGILLTNLADLFKNYLIGSVLVVLFYWALATVQLWVTGVPNAFVYGFIIGLPNFIPNVGGYFSTFLIFIITLFAGSETITMNPLIFAFLEMAFFMLASGVAYYFVDVRVYSRSVDVPVWLILLGIIAFGSAFGFLGIIIAAAAIAMASELLDFILKKVNDEDPYPGQPEPTLFAENQAIVDSNKKEKRKAPA
jgi:predicted PurR-regulated permease PerM